MISLVKTLFENESAFEKRRKWWNAKGWRGKYRNMEDENDEDDNSFSRRFRKQHSRKIPF